MIEGSDYERIQRQNSFCVLQINTRNVDNYSNSVRIIVTKGDKMKSSKKLSVSEKVRQEHPEFVAEVVALSIEDLNARLASHAKQVAEVEDAKEADEELAQAREVASALAAPYAEAKKAINQKTRFIVELIKEKGGQ